MSAPTIRRPAIEAALPTAYPPVGDPSSPQPMARASTILPPAEGNPATRTAKKFSTPKHGAPSGSQAALLDQWSNEDQGTPVEQGPYSTIGQHDTEAQKHRADGGPSPAPDHGGFEARSDDVGGGPDSPPDQPANGSHECHVGRGSDSGRATRATAVSNGTPLLDPTLLIAAEIVDDLEKSRVANENRLRQLTRNQEDADGEERGFGLTEDHPAVARVVSIVGGLKALEHEAVLNVQRAMRSHPLGPWVKAQRGIGEKQAARLLAAIGDPYWNTLHDRPRTVSELWAYCGYHVLPAGHCGTDDQSQGASGDPSSGGDSGHGSADSQTCTAGVAPRRQRGQKSNWSEDARKRSWLIVQSVIKAGGPWREVYDARKAKTEGKLHDSPCVRCGPKGKPAQIGTSWSDGHRHADAIRITAKEILKGLWLEARRLHELPAGGHLALDAQSVSAAGRDLQGGAA